jgi:hypothetical protein
MVAKARDTVGWLMPNPLANCVPDWGPVAKRRRSRSVWVGMNLNEKMNNKRILIEIECGSMGLGGVFVK